MAAKPKEKTYPSRVLRDKLAERGITAHLSWEIEGAPGTLVAWLSCYQVVSNVCIVETYRGGGWEAFTPNMAADIDATIADVIARCGADAAKG